MCGVQYEMLLEVYVVSRCASLMRLKEDRGGNKRGRALNWHNNYYFGICKPDQVKYVDKTQANTESQSWPR